MLTIKSAGNTIKTATPHMLSKSFTIAGHKYEYTTETTRTRSYVTEHAYLYMDGEMVAHGTDSWMNRPWYNYRFQNAIHAAVRNFFNEQAERAVENWKTTNGRRAIPKARREEIAEPFLALAHRLVSKVDKAHGAEPYKRETLKQKRARIAREERATRKAQSAA